MLLVLKLLLVPALLAVVTLAGRQWGQRVAGWLGGFPIVAGPILFVVALEHGREFAAGAARASLAGMAPTMLFFVAYSRTARRGSWPASLLAACLTWLAAAVVLEQLSVRLAGTAELTTLANLAAIAVAALVGLPRVMGERPEAPAVRPAHPIELPARMLVGALLALFTSTVVARLGPAATGISALFPVIGTTSAVFAHAMLGRDAARAFLAGMARGMWSVGAFSVVLSLALPRLAVGAAFALTALATVACHALVRPRGPGR